MNQTLRYATTAPGKRSRVATFCSMKGADAVCGDCNGGGLSCPQKFLVDHFKQFHARANSSCVEPTSLAVVLHDVDL